MILYIVGKLAPKSSHLTRGLVKYVLGRGYFRAVPTQNGEKFVTSPSPPPIVERVESDGAITDEEEEAFICDMSGGYNDESNDEGGCSALAWQVGDLTVICDSGASCHSLINRNSKLPRVERLHADGERIEIPDRGLWRLAPHLSI